MSALVLRFRANAQYLTKQYVCLGAGYNIQRNSWTCDGRRKFSADAATATNATTREGGSGTGNVLDTKVDVELVRKLKGRFEAQVAAGGVIPVFKKALLYGNKVAIKDEVGEFTYYQIYNGARKLASDISNICDPKSSSKVAFLCPNTAVYSLVQWACWFSGQLAVPLSSRYPANLLEYYIKDSEAKVIVTVPEFEPILKPVAEQLKLPLIVVSHEQIPPSEAGSPIASNGNNVELDSELDCSFYSNSNALILYTSGSTGPPKGTVISHRNLQAQTTCLADAWKIDERDSTLHILPLNHVHGCVNGLLCPLSVGAKVSMQRQFDPATVWSTLLNVNLPSRDRINLFMAVPTIYSLLIAEYEKVFSKNDRMVEYIRAQCEKKIRLMISGSAPLPTTVFNTWKQITGHKLLERYGMTEIGMALSNPYYMDKNRDRVPGTVGVPLPGTEVKIVSGGKTLYQTKSQAGEGFWSNESLPLYEFVKDTTDAPKLKSDVKESASGPELAGELYVRGPSVFVEYYKKPEETSNSFENGWFKTGDVAKFENGVFRILGRSNIDIIKTGGYKVSALNIETHIMENPAIEDVCVLGIPDLTWGQKVAALVVHKGTEPLDIAKFKEWMNENLASYQVPTDIKVVKELPRNAMGKVNKREIAREYFIHAAPEK